MRSAAAVVALVGALAGCSFGSDSGNAEFIRDADTICQQHERQISQIPQPQTFLRDFAVYMRRVVPIARAQLQELRGLQAPDDIAADYGRMLALLGEQLDMWRDAGEQAYAGLEAEAQSLYNQSSGPGGEAQRLAEEIGFFSCARPEG